MVKNKAKDIYGKNINISQKGRYGNSTQQINGSNITIKQDSTSKDNDSSEGIKWSKRNVIVAIVAIIITVIIAIVNWLL
jgi:hypothetical protein